jgi:hypothetical protein
MNYEGKDIPKIILDNITKIKVRYFNFDEEIKIGYIDPKALVSEDDVLDQDTSFAFHKQSLENQKKLRDFCVSRNSTLETNYDNYDLLSDVEQNTEKINLLQGVLDNLIKYNPDKKKIQEQFPLLYPPDFTK